MADPLALSVAWLAGAGLGAFFFGGLWWTVRRLADARRPALLVLGSFVLRTGVALGGFYLVATAGRWERILAYLLGFVTARLVVTRLTEASSLPRSPQPEEPHHASESR
jgi:F1F0 ATPase subunit 2